MHGLGLKCGYFTYGSCCLSWQLEIVIVGEDLYPLYASRDQVFKDLEL
jgi:hypothetical protein